MVFSFTSTAGTADEFGATVADPRGPDLPSARHTTSTDATWALAADRGAAGQLPGPDAGFLPGSWCRAIGGARAPGQVPGEQLVLLVAFGEEEEVHDERPDRTALQMGAPGSYRQSCEAQVPRDP